MNLARTDTGATPLHIAARYGHLDVVQLLLAAAGVNVNKARHDGATALYMAGPSAGSLSAST